MKSKLPVVIAFIAVIFGLIAIIKLVSAVSAELTVGFVSLTFGLTAIMWTMKARKKLSIGSTLRKYTTNFVFCLLFLLAFSVWHAAVTIFQLEEIYGVQAIYPQYFFITLAYLTFVLAGYQILYLGKQFGFEGEAKKIREVIKEKQAKKK